MISISRETRSSKLPNGHFIPALPPYGNDWLVLTNKTSLIFRMRSYQNVNISRMVRSRTMVNESLERCREQLRTDEILFGNLFHLEMSGSTFHVYCELETSPVVTHRLSQLKKIWNPRPVIEKNQIKFYFRATARQDIQV